MACAQAHRRHTFGVLLREFKLQLVLHTRVCIVVSEPFDIRNERLSLVATFAALWMASFEVLGFDSHFLPAEDFPTNPIGSKVTIEDDSYTIKTVISCARDVFGRGTAIYLASRDSPSVKVVIKVNTPPILREIEANLLNAARGVSNVITVEASAIWGDVLEGLGLEEEVKAFELRETRVVVLSPVCEPLEKVRDLQKLKICFRKLLIGLSVLC